METANVYVNEKKLLKHITPKIEEKIEERLKYRIVQSIIDALEEQFYPPEGMIREEFIKEVEEAEKEIKKGKCKVYSYEEFKKKFQNGQ